MLVTIDQNILLQMLTTKKMYSQKFDFLSNNNKNI